MKDISILPCPFCDSNNLSFESNNVSGHGDSGFTNARIQCNDCSGSKGKGYGYGQPDDEDKFKAWNSWNNRQLNNQINPPEGINNEL